MLKEVKNESIIDICWPSLNKNNSLEEVIEEIDSSSYWQKGLITHELELKNLNEWLAVVNNLLKGRTEFAHKGGTKELGGDYIALVIKVYFENRVIYVDPQGYNYARYVGLDESGLKYFKKGGVNK